jgi:ABC-2 type transport system ATP-binding protein
MTLPRRATDSVDPVIDIRHLSRTFGRQPALADFTLAVPRGCVLGLVGVNGSGKTTLIKHILGLLKAQSGRVRVFGLDPVADPVGVLSRIGYLSEDCDLPDWMTVAELLRYTAAFYPGWDFELVERWRQLFQLHPTSRVRALSRGLRARLGLLTALGHRPELLILDEPSAGLDPLARRDILAGVVRTVADEGHTVLFSSHLLDEVERIADRIALVDGGRLVFHGPLDEVQQRHRRLTLRFGEPRPVPPTLAGVLAWQGDGQEWTALCERPTEELRQAISHTGGRIVEEAVPGLDEVFAAHAGGYRNREED